jgi:hypothetical protein
MIKIKNCYILESQLPTGDKIYFAALLDKHDQIICANRFSTKEDAEKALLLATAYPQIKNPSNMTYTQFEKKD